MSRLRWAAILGSSCLKDPAAAFRGLANGSSSFFSRFSFNARNDLCGIKASPRTSSVASSLMESGILRIVLKFAVMSSPVVPSPRVAPRTNLPFS